MNAAGCLVLASCGEKQSPAANAVAPAPTAAVADTPPAPVPPEPKKPEGPAYPPAVMAELEKLKKEYPEIAVNVDAELARLKDYEHAEKIFQSDLPVIAKEYADLLSCSPGGRYVFFDEDLLATKDPKKLILIRFAEDRVQRIVGGMRLMPAGLNDKEQQAAYDRILLLEQASRRLEALKYACFFRQFVLMPRFREAVQIGSENGKLAEVRAARRLLDVIQEEEGLLNYNNSKHAAEILRSGERSVAEQLGADGSMVSSSTLSSGMGWQLQQKFGIYESLKNKFQRGEITLLDVAMIGAMERSIRHGLKTTELKQAALSVAGGALKNWMPEAWESISHDGDRKGTPQSQMWQAFENLEKITGIPFAVSTPPTPEEQERAKNPYSLYGEQPKVTIPRLEAIIYMNQRGYKGSEFTKMVWKGSLKDDIFEIVEKGKEARGSYQNDWTLDAYSENGKLKPFPKWTPPSRFGPQAEEEK